MRKPLIIAGLCLGALVIVVGAIVLYAAFNLNWIVAQNRGYLISRLSEALGRDVQAQSVSLSLGWGMAMQVDGFKVADDPSFSQLPFLSANRLNCRVELMPLLRRELRISELNLIEPVVRVVRNRAGELNVSSFGRKNEPAESAELPPPRAEPAKPPAQALTLPGRPGPVHPSGAPIGLAVDSLKIQDGQVFYVDQQESGPPLKINRFELSIDHFSLTAPFNLSLKLAVLGSHQNITLNGKAGPMTRQGRLDINQLPLSLDLGVGPLLLDNLRTQRALRRKIPTKLSMPDPVSFTARLKGTPEALDFRFNTDLSAARILYLGLLTKPEGIALKATINGKRRDDVIRVDNADLTLGDLQARITDVDFGPAGWQAKVATNSFELHPLSKILAAAQPYLLSGHAQANLQIITPQDKQPSARGTVKLQGVSFKSQGAKSPKLTGLDAVVELAGNQAKLERATFKVGATSGWLTGRADSLQPLLATYELGADHLRLADFAPERPPDEQISALAASGSVRDNAGVIAATSRVTSTSGLVSGVPYGDLAAEASYDGDLIKLKSLTMAAYQGRISGSGQATVGKAGHFEAAIDLRHVDLQQVLAAQKAKAAGTVRGMLSGNARIAGTGRTLDEIKPTLSGAGALRVEPAQLVGINVAAQALRKVQGVPGINQLVTPQVIARHPELFHDPNTDLKQVALSFQLTGPRLTTHDLTAIATDYRVTGDGWFDMDRNVALSAHLLLSRELGNDLRQAKRDVVYLANNQGEIDIPMLIRGTLPKPVIQPDVSDLAQRVANRAVQDRGQKLLNKLLHKKGLGDIYGSDPNAPSTGDSNSSGNNPSSNPLAPLRKLFH